jgi:hypothetical protein
MLFEREIGDAAEVVALIQELFGESCAGEESLAGPSRLARQSR